jgi:SET domain-containing protein
MGLLFYDIISFMKSVKSKIKKDKDFKVVKAEKGAGFGLVANKEFKKGDFVIEYVGIKKLNKDIEYHTGKYLFEVDETYTIDGSPRYNTARYINHSCRPNCEVEIDKDGKILIMAIKNIKPGDELTYDYGKEYFNEFIKPIGCKCVKCLNKK